VTELERSWGWRQQRPDDFLRESEVPEAAAAGQVIVDSISTSISNTEGRLLLRLTAHALLQDMYRPGWYVATVVHSDQVLDAVLDSLSAAAGPDGNSFVLKHGQRLLPLPAEDKAGLCGSMQIGRRNVGLIEYDDFAKTKSAEVYVLACSRQPMLSIAAGLKLMPEVIEREKLLEVEDRRAFLEQQQEEQQQDAGSAAAAGGANAAAAAAAAQMPFKLLVTFVPPPVVLLATHTAAAAACTRLAGSCSLANSFCVSTARVVAYNWQWCCCCQCSAQAYCCCILLAVALRFCSSARERPRLNSFPVWLIGLKRCHCCCPLRATLLQAQQVFDLWAGATAVAVTGATAAAGASFLRVCPSIPCQILTSGSSSTSAGCCCCLLSSSSR
jgi:hypothetical protein